MESFSVKEYLSLTMPTEDVPLSDQQRIRLALQTLGYEPVTIPLQVLRKLYPLCRNADFDITVTLVRREDRLWAYNLFNQQTAPVAVTALSDILAPEGFIVGYALGGVVHEA